MTVWGCPFGGADYLVFTCQESYHRQVRSLLLRSGHDFPVLINLPCLLIYTHTFRMCSFSTSSHVYPPTIHPFLKCFYKHSLFHWLEGVAIVALLHGSHDVLIDAERQGDGEDGQREVGQHAEEGEEGQGEEHQEHGAKHHPCLAHIAPVDQVQHWNTMCSNQSYMHAPALCIQASHRTLGKSVVQDFHHFQHEASWGNGLTILQSGHATGVIFSVSGAICFVLKSKSKHYLWALWCWHYTCIINYTYKHPHIYLQIAKNLSQRKWTTVTENNVHGRPTPIQESLMGHLMTASFDACSKSGCFF